jgi:hypothetical protein
MNQSAMNDPHHGTVRPSTRQVLLGLFIVGQVIFLITANILGFLKDNRTEIGQQAPQVVEALAPGWSQEKGHVWQLMEHIVRTDKMWAQVTGQLQAWSLFAPTIARECVFPAVEYRWDPDPASAPALGQRLALLAASHSLEATCLGAAAAAPGRLPALRELVLSENEPANPADYFRVGNFRVRRYENNLVLTLRPEDEDKNDPKRMKEHWSKKIRAHAADYADILHGYLRWRLARDEVRWPARGTPRQVILILRRYHINDYQEAPPYWSGPHAVPLVRWQPGVAWDLDHQPVEWYDPVSERFKSLAK